MSLGLLRGCARGFISLLWQEIIYPRVLTEMWKIRWCIGPNKIVHEPSKESKVGPVVANCLSAGWLTVWETFPCTPVMASLGTAHVGFNRLFLVSIACLMQFVHPTYTQHAHERFGGETSPTLPKRKGLLKQTQAHWRMHWSHPYRNGEIWQDPHGPPMDRWSPNSSWGWIKANPNHSQPRLEGRMWTCNPRDSRGGVSLRWVDGLMSISPLVCSIHGLSQIKTMIFDITKTSKTNYGTMVKFGWYHKFISFDPQVLVKLAESCWTIPSR